MKTFVLVLPQMTFMVDGLRSDSADGQYTDQCIAIKMIFDKYKTIDRTLTDAAAFKVHAMQHGTNLSNAVIDGNTISGKVCDEKVSIEAKSAIIMLNVKEFELLNVDRYDLDDNPTSVGGPEIIEMKNGEYVTYDDYKALAEAFTKLQLGI